MSAIKNIEGQRFGRWTVIGPPVNTKSVLNWPCRCDCGVERQVFGGDLKRGGSISCGCHMREVQAKRLTTHGLARHPAYRSWVYMHQRCGKPNDTNYALYGGRGIKVCLQWETFEGFWLDMAEGWFKGASIDRLDVNGHYEPGNCEWATPKEQANNRRTNHIIETPWGPMTITAAAERANLPPGTVHARIRYGWPESRLLDPVRKAKRQ